MLYNEQSTEPRVIKVAAAWVVRNRVQQRYRGYTTYRTNVESGEFSVLSEAAAQALSDNNLRAFNELLTIARGVINGSEANPMANVLNAIFFANSSYSDSSRQATYERLLNDSNGCVGTGNWGFFEGFLGRFYYYRNNANTRFPCSIPFP
jgi:hypothetical protein